VYGNDVRLLNPSDNKYPLWQLGFTKFSTCFAFAPAHVAGVVSAKSGDIKELKAIVEAFPTLKLDSDTVLAAFLVNRSDAAKTREHFDCLVKVKTVFPDLDQNTIAEALAGESGSAKTKVDRVIEKLLAKH